MSDNLTDGQLRALRNLADKRAGNITAFVNIADARHLTELGLATCGRQGGHHRRGPRTPRSCGWIEPRSWLVGDIASYAWRGRRRRIDVSS